MNILQHFLLMNIKSFLKIHVKSFNRKNFKNILFNFIEYFLQLKYFLQISIKII